jgi:hypothetical protein
MRQRFAPVPVSSARERKLQRDCKIFLEELAQRPDDPFAQAARAALAAIVARVGGETVCSLPEHNFNDRQTGLFRLVEDQARNVLRRGVAVHDVHTFASVAENG